MRNKKIPQFTPVKQKKYNIASTLLVMLLILILIVATILVSSLSVTNSVKLDKQKITISNLKKDFEGFSILHISDLNGDEKAISKFELSSLLKGNSFNAVCLTGDMIGSSENTAPLFKLIETLKSLNSKAPIYFITGDCDPEPVHSKPYGNTEVLAEYILELQKLGVIFLDRPTSQDVGKYKIWFSPEYLYSINPQTTLNAMTNEIARIEKDGLQYEEEGSAIYRSLSYRSRIMESTIETSNIIKEHDIQVALSHTPLSSDYVSSLLQHSNKENLYQLNNVSLVLSGHYVGGQWALPNGNPIYVPELGFFPSKENVVGKSRILTLDQYISPGLSTSSIYPFFNFRLFNQPSICILRLSGSY